MTTGRRAPPHVGPDLRAAALARRDHATHTRAKARTASPAEQSRLLAQAEAHQQLAGGLEHRETALAQADARRASWHHTTPHHTTTQARTDAQDATAELRRRLPDADIPRLHTPASEQPSPAGPPPPEAPSAEPHRPTANRTPDSPPSNCAAQRTSPASPGTPSTNDKPARNATPNASTTARPTNPPQPAGPTAKVRPGQNL